MAINPVLVAASNGIGFSPPDILTTATGDPVAHLLDPTTGYFYMLVFDGRSFVRCYVHRFIAYLKFGATVLSPDIVVRHKDGVKINNDWSNLLVGTYRDNYNDLPDQLLTKRFTALKVATIRTAWMEGASISTLAKKHGTSRVTIRKIVKMESYS